MMRWGTWEELVLGGAVLRHGTRAWDAVAAELQTRTLLPYIFTPEVCRAKYEDLEERYSGSDAWYEELRKRRVAELKRELERSEDSIGSLQSKLENLKAEIGENFNSDSPPQESYPPAGNTDRDNFTGKERSKDGLSAGSFTEETRRDWSPESQIPAISPQETEPEEIEGKPEPEFSEDSERQRSNVVLNGNLRRVRGKRKRRANPREASAGESDVLSSVNANAPAIVVESTEGFYRNVRFSGEDSGGDLGDGEVNMTEFLEKIVEHEFGSVFRRRLDSQKRARYKKMIRRHLDLEMIKSKLEQGSYSGSKELLRDLLLLFNNALVYYPENSHEYKSAFVLREFTTKKLLRDIAIKPARISIGAALLPERASNLVKPRSARSSKSKVVKKVMGIGNVEPITDAKKSSNREFTMAASPEKRGVGRPAKSCLESGKKRSEAAAKAGKRGRRNW